MYKLCLRASIFVCPHVRVCVVCVVCVCVPLRALWPQAFQLSLKNLMNFKYGYIKILGVI